MHTLVFYEPGHFHAALILRSRNERLDRSVHVYARDKSEVQAFLDLVSGFNSRPVDPTDWDVRLHISSEPLDDLISERRGEVVVIAGRNNAKLGIISRLHEAGFHVLADKPWLTSSTQLSYLESATRRLPVAMDLMTGRHDVVSRLRRRIVATESVFGTFRVTAELPTMEFRSIHHLCKDVDGRPMRRPRWFYDVEVQGDGLVDIQSHMVDQVQWLVDAAGIDNVPILAGPPRFGVDAATRWTTEVTSPMFEESTGATSFPATLSSWVHDGVLLLACNGQIDYRLGPVSVRQRAEWRHRAPVGGGDTHWSIVRGTGADVVVDHDPSKTDSTKLYLRSGRPTDLLGRVSEAIDDWQVEFPGLEAVSSADGIELRVPAEIDAGHESHFGLVLDEFLDRVEGGVWPEDGAAEIRERYTLLAYAQELAL